MSIDSDIAAAKELLAGLEPRRGPLRHRKMFGGAGLYAEDQIFAVLVDGALLVKADPKTAPELAAALAAAGAERWRYQSAKRPTPVEMPYWRLPDAAADDPEAACAWAERCLAALQGSGA